MDESKECENIVYKKQLKPVMNEIIRICNENHMPCFIACGVELNDDGLFDIKSMGLVPEMYKINTKDRRFTDFMNILNGFKAVYPEKKAMYQEDDYHMVHKETNDDITIEEAE